MAPNSKYCLVQINTVKLIIIIAIIGTYPLLCLLINVDNAYACIL